MCQAENGPTVDQVGDGVAGRTGRRNSSGTPAWAGRRRAPWTSPVLREGTASCVDADVSGIGKCRIVTSVVLAACVASGRTRDERRDAIHGCQAHPGTGPCGDSGRASPWRRCGERHDPAPPPHPRWAAGRHGWYTCQRPSATSACCRLQPPAGTIQHAPARTNSSVPHCTSTGGGAAQVGQQRRHPRIIDRSRRIGTAGLHPRRRQHGLARYRGQLPGGAESTQGDNQDKPMGEVLPARAAAAPMRAPVRRRRNRRPATPACGQRVVHRQRILQRRRERMLGCEPVVGTTTGMPVARASHADKHAMRARRPQWAPPCRNNKVSDGRATAGRALPNVRPRRPPRSRRGVRSRAANGRYRRMSITALPPQRPARRQRRLEQQAQGVAQDDRHEGIVAEGASHGSGPKEARRGRRLHPATGRPSSWDTRRIRCRVPWSRPASVAQLGVARGIVAANAGRRVHRAEAPASCAAASALPVGLHRFAGVV